MITALAAIAAARHLLATQPPAHDPVAPLDPELHGRWWVVSWTLEANLGAEHPVAPPPGVGPVVVDSETGAASYLGSQSLDIELRQAEQRLRDH